MAAGPALDLAALLERMIKFEEMLLEHDSAIAALNSLREVDADNIAKLFDRLDKDD